MVRNIVSAVAISLVLLPLSHTLAHAAAGATPGIRPGLWKLTIKVDDDPPETSTECVTKDEWKTFQARLTKDGTGCKTNEKTSPGRLSAEVNCESGGRQVAPQYRHRCPRCSHAGRLDAREHECPRDG